MLWLRAAMDGSRPIFDSIVNLNVMLPLVPHFYML